MSIKDQRLAVDGGAPVRNQPFPPWPEFDEEMIEVAASVLRSGKVNYWTGQECRLFEEEFAQAFSCRRAIAVANGTLALELALFALGIGPGDEVIVPCRTFIATASCVAARGATPVLADVDPQTQNITAETAAAVLTDRCKAVIAVHLAGCPCDMNSLQDFCRENNLKLIEDCAQAHGATFAGQPVGSLSDVAAFSFCQDKIITTAGEGGMLTTNDESLWQRAWEYKDHGKSLDAIRAVESQSTVFKYLHGSFGTNWRMTEIQAAIGRVALRRLPEWIRSRRRNAQFLEENLRNLPGMTIPTEMPGTRHAYYKFYAYLNPQSLPAGWDRDRVVRAIQKEGIPCGSGVCPDLGREAAFGRENTSTRPNAAWIDERSLMFQVHPTLQHADLEATVEAVAKVVRDVAKKQPGQRAAA